MAGVAAPKNRWETGPSHFRNGLLAFGPTDLGSMEWRKRILHGGGNREKSFQLIVSPKPPRKSFQRQFFKTLCFQSLEVGDDWFEPLTLAVQTWRSLGCSRRHHRRCPDQSRSPRRPNPPANGWLHRRPESTADAQGSHGANVAAVAGTSIRRHRSGWIGTWEQPSEQSVRLPLLSTASANS